MSDEQKFSGGAFKRHPEQLMNEMTMEELLFIKSNIDSVINTKKTDRAQYDATKNTALPSVVPSASMFYNFLSNSPSPSTSSTAKASNVITEGTSPNVIKKRIKSKNNNDIDSDGSYENQQQPDQPLLEHHDNDNDDDDDDGKGLKMKKNPMSKKKLIVYCFLPLVFFSFLCYFLHSVYGAKKLLKILLVFGVIGSMVIGQLALRTGEANYKGGRNKDIIKPLD